MRLIRADAVETRALGTRGSSLRLIPPGAADQPLELYINTLVARGGPGPYHYHSNAENIYVILSGAADVTVGAARMTLGAGDTIVLARGERHDIENAGAEPLRVLEIKVPAGSDFVMAEEERSPDTLRSGAG